VLDIPLERGVRASLRDAQSVSQSGRTTTVQYGNPRLVVAND
jgi:hypothetical protein